MSLNVVLLCTLAFSLLKRHEFYRIFAALPHGSVVPPFSPRLEIKPRRSTRMPAIRPQETGLTHKQIRPSARQSKRKCGASGGLLATKPRDLERFIDDYSYGHRQVKTPPTHTKVQLLRPPVPDPTFECRALLVFSLPALVGRRCLLDNVATLQCSCMPVFCSNMSCVHTKRSNMCRTKGVPARRPAWPFLKQP